MSRPIASPDLYSGMMFGLSFEKLLIIGVIAVFVVGPERLPHYATQLARLVRTLRETARTAGDRAKEELGPEFDDVDWKKLDPRQYDPRRIIRDALRDDAPKALDESPATRSSHDSSKVPTPYDSEAT